MINSVSTLFGIPYPIFKAAWLGFQMHHLQAQCRRQEALVSLLRQMHLLNMSKARSKTRKTDKPFGVNIMLMAPMQKKLHSSS